MNHSKQLAAGSAAIMLAALFWSLDGLLLLSKFYALSPELVVFWEHLLGLIILSPFLFINYYKIKALSFKSWSAIIWISVFGGLIGTLMITKAFFAAMDGQASFATVIVLQKLQPFFALFLARVVLKEKLPGQFYLWTALAIIASYLLVFSNNLGDFIIDWRNSAAAFAVIAAFAFGSSTVFGKRIANHLDYKAVAALRFLVTSVLAFVVVVSTGNLAASANITSTQYSLLALIVFTSGAGGMFLYYFGLRRVSASTATILELFWPLSALILDAVFNKNFLSPVQIIAVLLLLGAFYKVSALGRMKLATFRGRVIPGAGRGRRIGYRTANLDNTDLDIPHGIYVVDIKVLGQNYHGLMHFGFRDVYDEPVSLEILVKDFNGDIYGEEMTVSIVRKIRDVKNFPDTASLVKAIEKDLQELSLAKSARS